MTILRHAVEDVAAAKAHRPGAARRLVGRVNTRGPRALDARYGPYTSAPPERYFFSVLTTLAGANSKIP